MKQILITIAALVLVGCGESQQSVPAPEVKLVEPSEPVAEAAKPEPPTAKAPNRSIHGAAYEGNIEAVIQHIAAGTDVNARCNDFMATPLHYAVSRGHERIVELLITAGADVNIKDNDGSLTPLHITLNSMHLHSGHKEVVKRLLDAGADVNAFNVDSSTPLEFTEIDWEKMIHPKVKPTKPKQPPSSANTEPKRVKN